MRKNANFFFFFVTSAKWVGIQERAREYGKVAHSTRKVASTSKKEAHTFEKKACTCRKKGHRVQTLDSQVRTVALYHLGKELFS